MTIREALVREAHDGGCAHWPTPIRCERWVDSTLEASPILSALVKLGDAHLALPGTIGEYTPEADALYERREDVMDLLERLLKEQAP